MPVRPTFPGVYIEEIPSGVRTIVGVATSIGAFIDHFARGPMNVAVDVLSMTDFESEFGGLDPQSEASYAIQQFFLNGGSEAYVIRVGHAGSFHTAQIQLLDAVGGAASLTFEAGRLIKGVSVPDPGAWGNFIRLDVDYDTTDPTTLFNVTVSEISPAGTQPVLRTETFRNLTMTAGTSFAVEVINEDSQMVQASVGGAANRPAQTGTVSNVLVSATLTATLAPFQFRLEIDAEGSQGASLARAPAGATAAQVLQDARGLLEAAIRAVNANDPRLTNATVQVIGGGFRVLLGHAGSPLAPGSAFNANSRLTFTEQGAGSTAADLGLFGVAPNVQQYSLGTGAVGAQQNAVLGVDGGLPDATDIIGTRAIKTGMFALEDADLFNILCIPRAAAPDLSAAMFTIYSNAEAYCLERRAFLIVDIPASVDTVQKMKDFLDTNATLRNRNAAVYFPRTRIADPLNNFRLRDIAPSGTMAGIYARTDNDRGVWKAPAGIDTTLRNVNELVYAQTDPENGVLNPLGINALRNFAVYGNIAWGARTLDGADVQASEWKYLPVRRFALFLEESLYRGTKWVVFEPNDEPLWAQIRLNVGAFLQNLFRQGAFQGQTPREAYFVKCDKDTTTQNDINLGIVNILVGFAPLKPAEFVIVKISQIAGQIQV
ncbi:MAG TPA: phage tail sheath C-terminal domain-containing protein [Candidatus Acidoferrales bacterium]|jgi:phage tail sheath protein FI|nr:phage tail sheath C-terminal domain-containing protein [Candidatus Acidoferrales bacterium]